LIGADGVNAFDVSSTPINDFRQFGCVYVNYEFVSGITHPIAAIHIADQKSLVVDLGSDSIHELASAMYNHFVIIRPMDIHANIIEYLKLFECLQVSGFTDGCPR